MLYCSFPPQALVLTASEILEIKKKEFGSGGLQGFHLWAQSLDNYIP